MNLGVERPRDRGGARLREVEETRAVGVEDVDARPLEVAPVEASDRGKREHIAWFCCFAPFEHPRYAICTMVENGEHGGSVAAPTAAIAGGGWVTADSIEG